MPRYHFNIRDAGKLEEDPDGTEFGSLDDAHQAAIKAARELIADMVLAGDVIDGQSFEITTDEGAIVLQVPFKSALKLQ
jgi:hypothetical protein